MPRPPRLVPAVVMAAASLAVPARPAAAQELIGRVVESPSGRVVGGVAVRLYRVTAASSNAAADSAGTDPAPVRLAVTSPGGAFALFPPAPGTYRVRVGAGALTPAVVLGADSSVQRVYAMPLDYGAPPYPAQVDTMPRLVPGTLTLHYPPHLADQDVTGCAAVEFVIDTAGRAEPGSVRVLTATRREFAQAGARALTAARFTPAVRDGRRVRAMAAMPLSFSINERVDPKAAPCDVAGVVAREPIYAPSPDALPPAGADDRPGPVRPDR